jgi:hypothetical protein
MVSGAPKDAVLLVDGIEVGPASQFSEDASVRILPGRHIVELKQGGRVIARREIFVDAQGIKTVDFSGTAQ